VSGRPSLDQLFQVLDQLQRLLPESKAAWDAGATSQLAVERLWITAGNLAEFDRRLAGVDSGIDPWAEIVALRNRLAHALPGDISADRVYAESVTDLPRLVAELRATVAS
jgi:hypothetical protein